MAITPFRRVLAANRGEIAIRVFRACTELGFRTVAIFSEEDRVHLHRYKADEAYLVGKGLEPVAAYLAEDEIVELAKRHEVDAIHPGYGFLSERASFARKCRDAGIVFVGPTPEVIEALGDKVAARKIAEAAGVPIVPGTPERREDGRGGARVRRQGRLPGHRQGGGRAAAAAACASCATAASWTSCSTRARSEAKKAFGDDAVFLEKLVMRPKHIEVQILGDHHGNLVHLYERDCSVQRRHQKVIEFAPAWSLPPALRARLRRGRAEARAPRQVQQRRHRRVPGRRGRRALLHRGQPAHPGRAHGHRGDHRRATWCRRRSASRRATGCPIRRSASAARTRSSSAASRSRCASPPRIRATTSCPTPGKITAYRPAVGFGIRLDDGSGYAGARISPYYDSLLVKITACGLEWNYARRKVLRALREFRIRGVKTNLPFLENVLSHPTFAAGKAHTTFIDETPELFQSRRAATARRASCATSGRRSSTATRRCAASRSRRCRCCRRAGAAAGAAAAAAAGHQADPRQGGAGRHREDAAQGPARPLTDTTWRDAHQSLLATRMRTYDIARVAPATAHLAPNLFSLEMWGGATFDVAYRFLYEDPWLRLEELRRLVPNVMFQMLLRGANAVGYTSYPDNVVSGFIEEAAAAGMDVFRIFDALNDVDNMQVAIEAAQKTGRIVEAAICYTGDVSDPRRTKYDLKYYVDLAKDIDDRGTHLLCIKDMAGLLKPRAATMLVKALKDAVDVPLHLHMHDTSGNGIADLPGRDRGGRRHRRRRGQQHGGHDVAAVAVVAGVRAGRLAARSRASTPTTSSSCRTTGSRCASFYAPFESGLKAPAADVYEHEIPGGQYSNLRAQAEALGVRWTGGGTRSSAPTPTSTACSATSPR